MPYVNYPTIGQTFAGPLGVPNMDFGNIVQQWEQNQNALKNEQINQQAAQQEYEQNKLINPYKVEAEQQLARQRRLTADYEAAAQPEKLAQLRQQVGERQFKQLDTTMQQLGQIGAMIENNNGKVPLQIRAHLESTPEGMKILSAADSDPTFGRKLREGGEAWVKTSAKMLSQTQKEKSAEEINREKLTSQELRDAENRRSRERQTQARIDAARELKARGPKGNDKMSAQQYAVELARKASEIEMDNPQYAQVLRADSMRWLKIAEGLASASATTRTQLDRDLYNQFGILPTGRPGQEATAPSAPADPYAGFKIR